MITTAKSSSVLFSAILVVCCLLTHHRSEAVSRSYLYAFGDDLDHRLPSLDEVSSVEIQLSVPIVFYDTTYSTIFVNDNGLVSFLTEVPSFFNAQFPLSYPIIAPFYSDVDITATGSIYYRETQSTDLLERATSDIRRHFSVGSTFQARSLFIVTWDKVGSYKKRTDVVNTFQVVIATDGSSSFIFFLYPEDGIQWIQGDGKVSSHPDARAQAGFMAGDGRLYTLRGSGTDQAKNFDKMSNIGKPGVWMFYVSRTGPDGNVVPADLETTPPDLLGQGGIQTCATTQIPCPPTANCFDYESGFCCKCREGYFGNGKNCLPLNEPQRINGKVNGLLNEVPLEDVDLHVYAITMDGRTYTAISRIPVSLGYDMQSLVTLGGIIGWMFGQPKTGMKNGFMLTGGVFNRTAEVEFPQSGHRVYISEQFIGLDVFNYMRVNIEVRGTLPSIPYGSKIEVDDYEEEYTRVSPGVIRSHSSRSYRLKDNILEVPFVLDQTISFKECDALPADEIQPSMKLKMGRNLVLYDETEQIVRFASANKIAPLTGDDPCKEGKYHCGPHSKCVVEGDTFRCICDQGYEYFYEENVNGERATCIDINECTSGRNNCNLFAECLNLPGTFTCRCLPGYTGNGISCEKVRTCSEITCDPNAICLDGGPNQNAECRCNAGYEGNGFQCQPVGIQEGDCTTMPHLCDPNADCIFEVIASQHVCLCRPGFRGNGIVCVKEDESCDVNNNCHENAACSYDENVQSHICICKPGYYGDGYLSCIEELEPLASCNEVNRCHPHAQCIYEDFTYRCKCNIGYIGDGYQCSRDKDVTCNVVDMCSIHAECVYDDYVQNYVCRCLEGFDGDGITCNPLDECNTLDDCDPNAQCIFDTVAQPHRYRCQCNPGFVGDGKACSPDKDAPCNVVNNCDPNAQCTYDLLSLQYICQCNRGFQGDGTTCRPITLPCNVINNCDVHAECVYSTFMQAYRCQCRQGYEGSGLACHPVQSCRDDISLCDPNAECVRDINSRLGFTCQCRDGYVGDGHYCTALPQHEGGYLLFTQGMSVLRMPFEPTRNNNGKLILMKPSQIAVGLDVDCLKGQMYWTDIFHKAIVRSNYDGSDMETIVDTEIESPEGIAVDWISGNVYWTDSEKDTIEVATFDGTIRKVLIRDNLVNPRGIALHPGRGKMYWSDWNRAGPKIEMANMDGTQRTVLISDNLGLPNMLSIDFDHDDLCWTDAGLHRIECIGLSGLNRRVIYTPAAYPFDLTISGGYIYWTDWEIKFIQKVDRNGGMSDALELPLGGNGKLYGIAHVPNQCPRVTTACAVQNGGCRHLCLPNGHNGRTCACPDAPDGEGEEAQVCNEL